MSVSEKLLRKVLETAWLTDNEDELIVDIHVPVTPEELEWLNTFWNEEAE